MACVLVIALTWDGENRVFAIVLMCGVFTALTATSGLYLAQLRASKPFDAVRREWRQDRELIDRLLASSGEAKGHEEQPVPG
jgi:uncharacterized membrane protein YqjE